MVRWAASIRYSKTAEAGSDGGLVVGAGRLRSAVIFALFDAVSIMVEYVPAVAQGLPCNGSFPGSAYRSRSAVVVWRFFQLGMPLDLEL
jgi:hypothetical protein